MRKIVKAVWTLVMILGLFAVGVLLADKYTLGTQLVRLRIVAASDSAEDQNIKLQVRDAVNAYLRENMPSEISAQQAKQYLCDNVPRLTCVAENKLRQLGYEYPVKVYLRREEAQSRSYETFSLPAGVYETLRVDIGEAVGQNWWCVIFPSLCTPETTEAFQQTAVKCGISENLTDTLTGSGAYEVRFFFLDCLGKLENLLHKS